MNLVELAQRLKRLRTERGLTLEEVASRGGLTRGWLSKVENFRVTPSLPALHGVALGLGVTLSELFEGLDARPPLAVVRKNKRVKLRRDEDAGGSGPSGGAGRKGGRGAGGGGGGGFTYEALAHARPSRSMDPFIITVPRSARRPMLAHSGEEFMHVLVGEIDLKHGDQVETLSEGDSAYFDGVIPHSVVCRSPAAAKLLVVYYGNDRTPGTDDPESGK